LCLWPYQHTKLSWDVFCVRINTHAAALTTPTCLLLLVLLPPCADLLLLLLLLPCSGAGLHVGHPEGYTATDIIARYKRMRGFNVLHPMGWDAFGLPAEQYAIQTGTHPAVTTQKNIDHFRAQLKMLGFSYDWQREISTTDPHYFKYVPVANID
jgi:hypothetical protein